MEQNRLVLRHLNAQLQTYYYERADLISNLMAILKQSYPGISDLFERSDREMDVREWADFVYTFWHADCVRTLYPGIFRRRYESFCNKNGYAFSESRADIFYETAKNADVSLPKDDTTRMLVQNDATMIRLMSGTAAQLKTSLHALAAAMPEYPVVVAMPGVGTEYAPPLIAEVGNIYRFEKGVQLTSYAGVNPGFHDDKEKGPIQKSGPTRLRRAVFKVMEHKLELADPVDEVYLFMDKKRKDGKSRAFCITAGANKFLRTYYAIVTQYLEAQGLGRPADPEISE